MTWFTADEVEVIRAGPGIRRNQITFPNSRLAQSSRPFLASRNLCPQHETANHEMRGDRNALDGSTRAGRCAISPPTDREAGVNGAHGQCAIKLSIGRA